MRLHIAIPAYQRHVDIGVLGSLCALLSNPAYSITLDHWDGSITAQVRNHLVRRFLETDAEWLMFWDNDIVIDTPDFPSLMLETSQELGAKIVAAACRVKGSSELNFGNLENNLVKRFSGTVTHPSAVDVAGTGLMLIHRTVLEEVSAPWFEVFEHQDGMTLGEDYNFCLKAAEKGFSTVVEPRITTIHYGVAGWRHQAAMTTTA